MAKLLLGIGNPLLDISVDVDADFLAKYDKKVGEASLANEKDSLLFKEIVLFPKVKYIAGGATQNAIRGAQWMSSTPRITHYIGSIGDDENGRIINEAATKDGVQTHYHVSKGTRTGSCAVLVRDKERSLVADLGAANEYKHYHFESPEIQQLLPKIDIVYSAGFFLTVSPETVVQLGKHCAEHNKIFVFLVAAPFLVQYYWDKVQAVLPYADFVIANQEEFVAFQDKAGIDKSNVSLALKSISELPKVNTARKRTVIITQGPDPVLTYHNDLYKEWKPIETKLEDIVDTNGAGDGWTGGFLAGLCHDQPFEECIRAAMYSAHQILGVSGTQYPEHCNFQWSKL